MRCPTLLCFDGSDDSAAAIERAGRLLGGGPAVVIHGWRPLMSGAFRYGPDIELTQTLRESAAEMDELGEQNAVAITRRGVELAREAGFEPVEGRTEAVPQSLWASLVDVARELDAEVMVLGAHGHSRVKHAVLGSVAGAVAHHADRPLLLIRQPPAA